MKRYLLFIVFFSILLTELFVFLKIAKAAWYNDAWTYRKPVTVSYTGATLTDFDVLIEIDTAALVTASKLQSDCDDIRFTDSDETTLLDHWVEGGCNTTTTPVWVRVPSIPNGGKTIYFYYGNSSASTGAESWSGTFTLMYNASCPAGWSQNADLDNRFPYGASTYGTTGGADNHAHTQTSCTSTNSATTGSNNETSGTTVSVSTHTHTGLAVVPTSASNVLPPYLNVVMCERANLVIPASFIAMYDTSVPAGWTRFSTLDNSFPRGATAYGGTGGSATHSHSTTGGIVTGNSGGSRPASNNSPARAGASHNHTSSAGTTDSGTHTPSYLDVIFGQANSQTTGAPNLITITDVLPPLGWTRFTALDAKLPRGAASYGGTGGATTHTHTVTISTGGASSTALAAVAGHLTNTTTHTHNCSTTTPSGSSLPPYVETIFAQRKDPVGDNSVTTSVGTEETVGAPNPPTIGVASAISVSSIRWNFTDNSAIETGFKVYDSSNNLVVTCASTNLSYCDETGLSTNTQYTRKVLAYNGFGNGAYSSTASLYTLAATPPAPAVTNRTPTTINVAPGGGTNPAGTVLAIYKEAGTTCDGSGGSYIAANGSDNGSTAVYQTVSTWGTVTVTGLSDSQNEYSFCTIAKNGDNVVTSFSSAASYRSCTAPASGNHTITADCSFQGILDGNNAARVINGVDTGSQAGGQDSNTATLTIQSGILTVNSNETIAAGKFVLAGGSIAIATGGELKVGNPIWMVDQDSDGFSAVGNKLYVQNSPPTNGRRRNLMTRVDITDCDDTVYQPAGCLKRSIALTYSGSTLTNHDVVFTLDTASLISAGKMTSDCGDIRLKDSDNSTALTYWIEGGCNTASTQVWTRIPSIPNGGKTIYLYYEGVTTANGFESWSGVFTLMYNTTCPAGWTRNTDFDSSFPQGAATYGGTGGGSSHSHAQLTCTTGGPTNTQTVNGNASGNSASTGTHGHANNKADVSTASSVVPPYLDMVMCESADLAIPASFVGIFDSSVPSGWTRFTSLDNTFPRGASSYGGTGGATTHSHSTTGGYTTNLAGGSAVGNNSGCGTAPPHTHNSSSGTTDTATNTPPYLDMVFGQKDSQGAASASLISVVDVIPPLGWTRFSALDAKFPRGASSYGGTGGATTSSHSDTVSTGGQSEGVISKACSSVNVLASSSHSHSCAATSDSQSNIPPYTNAIFAERNTPSASTAVGSEGYWW